MKVPYTGLAACLASLACLGCGQVILDLPAASTVPIAAGTVEYHAFGDSITAGSTLQSQAQAYPTLLAAAKGLKLTVRAISGDQACDVATRQVFRNAEGPSQPAFPLYTMMVGTNDADVKGAGAYETVYDMCQTAVIAWLAMPLEDKVLATSAQVTTRGPGALESANGWNAWQTGSVNASITFPMTLAKAGPVYIWRRIVDGDAGTYTLAIDGKAQTTAFTTSTSPAILTQNGTDNSLAFFRVASVSGGPHTFTFVQTSATGTMRIVGVGAPPITGTVVPTVVIGEIPTQRKGSGAPCDLNPAICVSYNADVKANADLFADDGFDVRYAVNHTYLHGDPSEMSDGLHPNALGHTELHTAFAAWIP